MPNDHYWLTACVHICPPGKICPSSHLAAPRSLTQPYRISLSHFHMSLVLASNILSKNLAECLRLRELDINLHNSTLSVGSSTSSKYVVPSKHCDLTSFKPSQYERKWNSSSNMSSSQSWHSRYSRGTSVKRPTSIANGRIPSLNFTKRLRWRLDRFTYTRPL